ncbi:MULTISPECIES: DUF1289 domain-containing protein [unclassified Variovorax]|uniref:DUF1289 domain-containing protein n=1 Tax=unclassified Variovorax TaxID=663243 RepID=UPI0016010C1E|nr:MULTISPECIES: DUF1289 domain-containing protein [unclassified Variovorax]MBB1603010.1 hypothetical protein [Variovorax sp. UMC13]MDM0091738.1 DUF1289 domain-containing protein [Variovorax sp. J22G40]MDM0149719.1 DUF1289 domain-containing protein [Variovorax sp. J2P1-31]
MTAALDREATVRLIERAAGIDATPDAEMPSPCVSVCRMDDHREFCVGCLRTIPEIAGWSRMDGAGKRAIWGAITQRLQAMPAPADDLPQEWAP